MKTVTVIEESEKTVTVLEESDIKAGLVLELDGNDVVLCVWDFDEKNQPTKFNLLRIKDNCTIHDGMYNKIFTKTELLDLLNSWIIQGNGICKKVERETFQLKGALQ